MKFKDVAHLYKGVMMRTQMGDFPLMMYHDGNWWLDTIAYGLNAVEQDIKPLLRPLDSMTEEEANKYAWDGSKGFISFIEHHKDGNGNIRLYPTDFLYLLSIGMDLFSLIPNNEAIDKTKHQKNG